MLRMRSEIGEPRTELVVPQTYRPGYESDVDFGEFYALIAGKR